MVVHGIPLRSDNSNDNPSLPPPGTSRMPTVDYSNLS